MSGQKSSGEFQAEPIAFGDHLLLRKIATGGMSEIFLARPADPARQSERYVLKRLPPGIAHIPNFIELFQTEARVASRLRHPNVVRILDYGVAHGQCFMTMEYVEGLDCWKITRRLARRVETLPLSQVIFAIASVLGALEHVHGLSDERGKPLGIVHRDVSPSNIYVSRRGEVKLGDFGIALYPGAEVETQRRTRLRGKLRYLSPEQVGGQPVDQRSDLFAVGVLLAELIIGRSPFRGQTDIAVLLNIRDVKLHLAEDLDERTPPTLQKVLLRSLSRRPEDRHQTAREMLDDVLGFASGAGLTADSSDLAVTVERLLKPGDLGDVPTRIEGTPTPSVFEPIGPRESRIVIEDATPVQPVYEYRVRRRPSARPRSPLPLDDGPGTAAPQGAAQDRASAEEGPFNYGEVVERILNGMLAPDDLISTNFGPYVVVASVPDMAQHLPVLTPVTRRVDEPGVPDRRGLIRDEPVARVFVRLAGAKDTGLLVMDCEAIRKEVYLSEGSPIYASSNVNSELLGEYLVTRGILSRMELEMALAVLPRYQGHLGDTLVALELLDPLTLFEHITDQVRRKILDLFTWKHGEWSFYRGVVCEKRVFPLASAGVGLIHEGILLWLSEEQIERWWTSAQGAVFEPVADPTPPVTAWSLTDPERTVLGTVNRAVGAPEALRVLLSESSLSRETALRAFAFCDVANLIKVTR